MLFLKIADFARSALFPLFSKMQCTSWVIVVLVFVLLWGVWNVLPASDCVVFHIVGLDAQILMVLVLVNKPWNTQSCHGCVLGWLGLSKSLAHALICHVFLGWGLAAQSQVMHPNTPGWPTHDHSSQDGLCRKCCSGWAWPNTSNVGNVFSQISQNQQKFALFLYQNLFSRWIQKNMEI